MHHEYELTVIVRPDIDEPATYLAFERVEGTITEQGGHLLLRDDWGKRKLAYGINKHTKGHYVLLSLLSEPGAILEVERKMRIDDRVIRFLTVKLEHDVDVTARVEAAAVARAAAEEEAKARAAAAAAAEALAAAAYEAKTREAEARRAAEAEKTPEPDDASA